VVASMESSPIFPPGVLSSMRGPDPSAVPPAETVESGNHDDVLLGGVRQAPGPEDGLPASNAAVVAVAHVGRSGGEEDEERAQSRRSRHSVRRVNCEVRMLDALRRDVDEGHLGARVEKTLGKVSGFVPTNRNPRWKIMAMETLSPEMNMCVARNGYGKGESACCDGQDVMRT